MKPKKSNKLNYEEFRRKQLIQDNIEEEKYIKQMSRKLGMRQYKRRKNGNIPQPRWVKESGLDYLFDYEKFDENSPSEIIGEGKTKKKKLDFDIYGHSMMEGKIEPKNSLAIMDSSDESDEPSVADESSFSEEETVEDIKFNDETKLLEPEVKKPTDDAASLLQRSIRRILNCVSEDNMSKSISDLVLLFSDMPRATVRRVLIEEVDILLAAFPLTRGQSVGWLQQELAACFVSTEAQLHHSGDDSRLVAHFVEFFVASKFPTSIAEIQDAEGGSFASRCLFVAYLYRFGALTGDLIMDLLEEFFKQGDLLALQISHHVVKPISALLRNEMNERCAKIVSIAKERISKLDVGDFEKSVELEGIVAILSSKHSKEPALSSSEHFFKGLKTWNKGVTFPKDLRLPLRLEELRDVKKGKGRWWAVGSAFTSETLSADSLTPDRRIISSKKSAILTPDLKEVAQRLGLITPMRQQLFATLVSTPGGPDCTATALLATVNTGSKGSEHHEREVVQIIMHCLVSEQPFNRFYTRVLGALLNNHRRFAMMIRCAFWDVMAKEELTREAKCNAGKAIGILASVYGFPLIVLKKFNFADESEANVGLLSATVTELTSCAFSKTLETFARVASANRRLGRNLRIFMRRLSKTLPDEASRSYLTKLVSELRDLFP